ncbi:MAG: hypothetical protein HFJ55_05890 [Clostridia bacterium]|nr:hypothetical protein [Clostridia bacterium]
MNKKIIKKTTAGILLFTMFIYTTPILAYTKNETVYSKINTNGEGYKTIVTDHISGTEEIIEDLSDLANIKNVSGKETFTKEGNKIIWKANGEDIHYQGESNKELPVNCNIKYELDGKEISAKEINGKSGKVKIIIQYTNKDEHYIEIEGKETKLYTPFLVGVGTIFNNDKNKNVEVKNGKVINDGSKTTVIGLVTPGLQESLNIDRDVIDIPDSMEITLDTTEFKLGTMISYITPKVFENEDIKIFEELDEIYSQVDTLKNASQEIENGAVTLSDGVDLYTEKSQEFNNAMNQVKDGVTSASNNYNQIDNGINTINENIGTLNIGAKNLKEGAKAITIGIETVDNNLGKIEIGSKALQQGEHDISAGVDQIIAGIDGIQITNNTEKIKELNQLVTVNKQKIQSINTTKDKLMLIINDANTDETIKETLKEQIRLNAEAEAILYKNNEAILQTIKTLENTDMTKMIELKKGVTAIKTGITELQNGTHELSLGISQLKQGTSTICNKMGEFVTGTESIYNGTKKLSEGTKTLKTGSNQMKTGLKTIDSATVQLLNADNKLVEGANTLKQGTKTLKDGIIEFNKNGIEPICNFVNNNIKDVTNRLEKLEQLSNQYNNFTMKDEKVKGNVEFIMIVEEKEENN